MNSIILRTAAHIVASLMLIFSFYLLLRGHNAPGGGFIGALVAVIAFSVLNFAGSSEHIRQLFFIPPDHIAMLGIIIALISGLIAFLKKLSFLTGLWCKIFLPLGTPLLFDIGVYFAIFGSGLTILLALEEQE